MALPELNERFQTVVDQHKKTLYKVCNACCRNRDDRDDLAQEIIIQLWRSFGKFDERYRFSTWMYRIALNVAISFYRRENIRTRYVISDEEQLLEAPLTFSQNYPNSRGRSQITDGGRASRRPRRPHRVGCDPGDYGEVVRAIVHNRRHRSLDSN